jgi:hypothetical protein
MPFTWRIRIIPLPNPQPDKRAQFVWAQQPQIQVGDQIFWSNEDSEPHFPVPDGDPQPYDFMANQVAPNSTSSAFAPTKAGPPVTYHCKLHPGETGSFDVT